MDTSDGYTEGEQGGHRPITRADEGRVRPLIQSAIEDSAPPRLHFGPDSILKTIECSDDMSLCASELAALARAGIVPGPEGWCWAPSSSDRAQTIRNVLLTSLSPADGEEPERVDWDDLIANLRRAGVNEPGLDEVTAALRAIGARSDGPGWILSVEGQRGLPPAWLTAAVLATLPPSGEPFTCDDVMITMKLVGKQTAHWHEAEAALAHLVSTGEIEPGDVEGTWRRWGVPDGWGWQASTRGDSADLYLDGDARRQTLASVNDGGMWTVFESEDSSNVIGRDTASPPTLAAAKRAALRACWERGLFAKAARPPLTAADGRAVVAAAPNGWTPQALAEWAQQIRDALLAALDGGHYVREDALYGAAYVIPGPAMVSMADLRAHLVSIGAVTNGARWRLSDGPPPGFEWRPTGNHEDHFLYRVGDTRSNGYIACAYAFGQWQIFGPYSRGTATSADLPSAQTAALAACRRAGLFAPAPIATTPAPVQPGPLPDWVRPAPSAAGANAPPNHGNPLRAAVQGIIDGEACELVEQHFTAWAAGIEERAVRACLDRLDERVARGMREAAERAREGMPARARRTEVKGGMLRVYGEDGETVIHEEQVPYRETRCAVTIAAAAERFARARAAAKRERSGLAYDELDATTEALCALFPVPVGAP